MTAKKPPSVRRTTDELLRARLRQNEQVFHLLVDSVQEYAIFMLDPVGIVSTWNQGARRLNGYEAEEIIGQHFSRFYPPEVSRDFIDSELDTALREGQFRDEGWRVRKDGSRLWADVTITPVREPSGRLIGFAKVTRDLTSRRDADEQKTQLIREQAARQAAERSDRMKDEFLATLSHELRTPLNAIIGWTHILDQDPRPETLKKGLAVIARNAAAQSQLVADILDVQRLASGRLRLNLDTVELGRIVDLALDTVRPAAAAKNISLIPIMDTAAPSVLGDAERLQQIVWNLLSNAIKFTPKGGRVAIRLMKVGSHVDLTVEDNGPGIAPEFLPHLFERFRQFDASSTRRHGGLGLGLSIVRSLAELHGGTVAVANAAHGGAIFSVRLPVASVGAQSPAIVANQAMSVATVDKQVSLSSAPSLKDVKVLVVDDDADGRQLVAQVLGLCGADVMLAGSAADAFPMVGRERPHVIVCDIGMPDEDGYGFIERVRRLSMEEGGATPAAALTAFASTQDRMRALNAGFQIHIPKPVQPAELVTVVASLIGRRRPS